MHLQFCFSRKLALIVIAVSAALSAAHVAEAAGNAVDWPQYRSVPASYDEAAKRAGLDASTVRKRIERFRDKLVDHVGVELAGGDYRLAICRFVLTHRLITKSDLAVLDEPE